MIRDILCNLDPILKISNMIKNNQINKFIQLTDSTILDTAKILKEHQIMYDIYKKEIDNIQKIINKINTRNIYKCVYSETFYTEENITNEYIFNKFIENITPKGFDIDDCDFNINSSRLKIVKIKIGLLGGDKSHPLDSVYFYDHNGKSILLDKTKISHLMTQFHQEVIYYIIFKP
jgi:hypothetical protein